MVNCNELFAKIEELNEKYLDVLEASCNMESPTFDKARVDAVSGYFASLAEERGWLVETFPMEVSGDIVVITMNPQAQGAPIALSGHLDTVHPVGLFGSPAVTREGEFMKGPGVLDCKGGVVAGFLAMEALDALGFRDRPVKMLLQTDEEKGSTPSGKATIRRICDEAQGAVAFLNLEGYTAGRITMTTRGILRYLFTVKGIAAHSSRRYLGANAVLEAAHKIIALEEASAPKGEGTTYNCGVIEGGTVPNSVAAECRFYADIRFATNEQMKTAEALVASVAAHVYVPGCSCEVSLVSERPATELVDRNRALLASINRIYKEAELPLLTERDSFGGSDLAYATAAGIPALDGFGTEGFDVHSKDERIYLSSLVESAKRIGAVVLGI